MLSPCSDRRRAARLPMAPRPRRGELLPAWQGRVAAVCGLTVGELDVWLRDRTGGPDPGKDPSDTDVNDEEPALGLWAHAARVDPERLRRMTLAQRFPKRPKRWLLHDGSPPWSRMRAMPPVCLSCLHDDDQSSRDAVVRAVWMRAEVCVCLRHGELLTETCPGCGADIAMAFVLRRRRLVLACGRCRAVFGDRARQGRGPGGEVAALLIAAQDRVAKLLQDGFVDDLDDTADRFWSRWSRARTRPEIDRWTGNDRPWPLQDRLLVNETHVFPFLSLRARCAMLPVLAAVTSTMTTPPRVAGPSRITQRLPRPPRRIHVPPEPRDDSRFLRMARQLLADPAWREAAALPTPKRQRAELRLIERALAGRLTVQPDSSEGPQASFQ